MLYTDADLPVDLQRAAARGAPARVPGGGRAGRLPLRPHRRRACAAPCWPAATTSLIRAAVRPARARRQLRVQALPPLAARAHRAHRARAASSTPSCCCARARRARAIIQIGLDYFPRSRGASTLSSPARGAAASCARWPAPGVSSASPGGAGPRARALAILLADPGWPRAALRRPRLGPAPPAAQRRARVRGERAPQMAAERQPRPPLLRVPGPRLLPAGAGRWAPSARPRPGRAPTYAARALVAVAGVRRLRCSSTVWAAGCTRAAAGPAGGALRAPSRRSRWRRRTMFRPDVVLQVGDRPRAARVRAPRRQPRGATSWPARRWGSAWPLKFSAVFLLPSYFAARLLAPGPRVARACALGWSRRPRWSFALASPCSGARARLRWRACRCRSRYHYEEPGATPVALHVMALEYPRRLAEGRSAGRAPCCPLLGLAGAARGGAGCPRSCCCRSARWRCSPRPTSATSASCCRALSVGFLLAGAGAARWPAAGRLRGAGAAAALCWRCLAARAAALASVWLARTCAARHARPRARLRDDPRARRRACSCTRAPARPRRRALRGDAGAAPDRRAPRAGRWQSDYVLADRADEPEALAGLEPLFSRPTPHVRSPGPHHASRPTRCRPALRPRYAPVALDAGRLSASEEPPGVPASWTAARTRSGAPPDPSRRATGSPSTCRPRALLGPRGAAAGRRPEAFAARELRVLVVADGVASQAAATLPGRRRGRSRPAARSRARCCVLSPPRSCPAPCSSRPGRGAAPLGRGRAAGCSPSAGGAVRP